ALVREKMKETYDLFTKRVADARSGIDLAKTAEGRLFTGSDAVKNRMADKVGGLDDCISDLATDLKLTPGELEIMEYPGPKSLADLSRDTLGGMAAPPNSVAKLGKHAGPAALSGALKDLVGARHAAQIRDQLSALVQLRKEPVILASPRAVFVK